MVMATSRIVACLLHGGRTTHFSLAIPLQLHDKSTCCISVQSLLAQRLSKVQLIVLDEACAGYKFIIKAIN